MTSGHRELVHELKKLRIGPGMSDPVRILSLGTLVSAIQQICLIEENEVELIFAAEALFEEITQEHFSEVDQRIASMQFALGDGYQGMDIEERREELLDEETFPAMSISTLKRQENTILNKFAVELLRRARGTLVSKIKKTYADLIEDVFTFSFYGFACETHWRSHNCNNVFHCMAIKEEALESVWHFARFDRDVQWLSQMTDVQWPLLNTSTKSVVADICRGLLAVPNLDETLFETLRSISDEMHELTDPVDEKENFLFYIRHSSEIQNHWQNWITRCSCYELVIKNAIRQYVFEKTENCPLDRLAWEVPKLQDILKEAQIISTEYDYSVTLQREKRL